MASHSETLLSRRRESVFDLPFSLALIAVAVTIVAIIVLILRDRRRS